MVRFCAGKPLWWFYVPGSRSGPGRGGGLFTVLLDFSSLCVGTSISIADFNAVVLGEVLPPPGGRRRWVTFEMTVPLCVPAYKYL